MKTMPRPSAAIRAQALEQLASLLRSEHGSRLVEDEHVGPAVEVLQDLDALLLADGELPDGRSGSTWIP